MKKKFAALIAMVTLAVAAWGDMTYAPFLFDANNAVGAPIANGTYVMVIDLDGDGWNGNPYVGAGAGDNSATWLWDADDMILDRGPVVDGQAFPFRTIATADIPATYDAGVDHYYVLWFDVPYAAGDLGPGASVAYGAEDLGTVGTNPGDYTPFMVGGNAIYQTAAAVTNHAPVLAAIGDKTLNEGALLTFTVTASDPNDTPPHAVTLSATGLPAGATFDPATGIFTWTPTEAQQGSYEVTFTATDDGVPPMQDSETITITVNEVNAAPVLAPIGNKTITALQPLTFVLTASDPNDIPQNAIAFSATGLPAGATLDPTTGAFAWTPLGGQAGAHVVTFIATDNGVPPLQDSETITITVNAVPNQQPVAQPVWQLFVRQGEVLEVPLTATDADGDVLTLSIVKPPARGTLSGIDQIAQTANYQPLPGLTGQDHLTFKANDGEIDSTVADVYIFVQSEDGWVLPLAADTADFPALYVGAEEMATDNYDANFDLLLPGEIVPTRGFRNFAGLYRPIAGGTYPAYFVRDIRQLDGDYLWVLELEAFEEDLTISWQIADLPASLPLRIAPCDADGVSLTAGDLGELMSDVTSVTVLAGEGVKYYRIQAYGEVEYLLSMREGWNLISLPLQPTNPSIDDVFDDVKVVRGGGGPSFRDGSRGTLVSTEVWDWDEDGQFYNAIDTIEAYQGYWVYLQPGNGNPTLRVIGFEVAPPATLKQHWNLIGVDVTTQVTSNTVSTSIWYWLSKYYQTSTLVPGLGYWLYSFEDGGRLIAR